MYHFFPQNCQFDYKEKTNDTAGLFKWLILYLYLWTLFCFIVYGTRNKFSPLGMLRGLVMKHAEKHNIFIRK